MLISSSLEFIFNLPVRMIRRKFAGMLSKLDDSVGMVVQALKVTFFLVNNERISAPHSLRKKNPNQVKSR